MTDTSLADVFASRARWCVAPCDNRFGMGGMPSDSVDAVCCDPPYELGFMGKRWDRSGIAYDSAMWAEVLRVAKPGAHLLAFGGTRTYHRMACAIEDAGWDVRDSLCWLYGSGFPKSLDVSKALDKMLGADRAPDEYSGPNGKNGVYGANMGGGITTRRSDPCTAAAAAAGYGTALKPAFEPVILARKPLSGTVAANWAEHGTGALNIDGCRIEGELEGDPERFTKCDGGNFNTSLRFDNPNRVPSIVRTDGRWPANVLLDEAAAALLDAQTGDRPGMSGGGVHRADYAGGMFGAIDCPGVARNDDGGPSRFFYTAKAPRSERDAGLEDFVARTGAEATDSKEGQVRLQSPRAGAGRNGGARNTHATVKPVDVMRWLVRLVTRPGSLVLDPFCGSGTTGVATMLEGDGRRFVGLELDPLHVDFARARIAHVVGGAWTREVAPIAAPVPGQQVRMF